MLNLRTISIKNIKTHPVRTIILFILTFAQLICIFGGIEMYLGMRQELSMAQERLGADLLVYPTAATSRISTKSLLMQGTPVEVYKERSMLSRMDSCENITAVSYQLYISDTPANGDKIWIFGIEPETDFVISPWLPGGSSSLAVNGNVAVGSKVELTEDQRVILYQQEWPVSGQLMETGSVLDESVFVSMDTLKQMIEAAAALGIDSYSSIDPSSYFSAALVRVDDKSKVGSVTDWINIYVRKVTAVHSEETLTQAASGIQGTSRTMALIALLAWLLLLVVLGIVYSMLMKERIREIYVWYCVGA